METIREQFKRFKYRRGNSPGYCTTRSPRSCTLPCGGRSARVTTKTTVVGVWFSWRTNNSRYSGRAERATVMYENRIGAAVQIDRANPSFAFRAEKINNKSTKREFSKSRNATFSITVLPSVERDFESLHRDRYRGRRIV